MDISIKELEYEKFNGLVSSQLTLECKGINVIIVNTLRRAIQDDLPIYAFPSELIKIEQNTSTMNNDQLRDHLTQLPILNQDCEISYLDPMFWKDVDYKDTTRTKHENEKKIELYINAHNVSPEIMNVRTDSTKFFVEGEPVDMYEDYTEKPLLIQLLPGATFKCHMTSALGTGERNNIWAAGLAYYYEEKDKIIFTVESFGQFDEYTILLKACEYIVIKLSEFKKQIEKRVTEGKISSKRAIIIELEDEDHTLGNVVNDVLQDHPNIIYSGISKPDHLVKTIKISIECDDKYPTPIEPLYQTIEHLKQIYKTIGKQLLSLNKPVKEKDNEKKIKTKA